MKKSLRKVNNEEQLVTMKYFKKFENDWNERFEKFGEAILKEIAAMRRENREFLQMREQLYSNDIKQEQKIDNLEKRVFKLEIAK